MEKIEVFPAAPTDIGFIAALEAACFPLPWKAEDFEQMIASPDRLLLVAKDGDAPLGYIAAYTVCGETDVTTLAVAPTARRRGVGRALLMALTGRLGAHPLIFLEVRASNTAARALYAACGFTETGVRRDYYRQPREDAILCRYGG